MDIEEREKLRRLANDAIIRYYGFDGIPSQLAVALEKAIRELDEVATCSICGFCDDHGDLDEDEVP